MKKITSIVIIISILLVCVTANAQREKFIYTPVNGKTMLSRTQGSTWLALGNYPVEISAGDILKLEGAARGTLMFPDGSISNLKLGAYATVMRNGLQMRIGYVWSKVRHRADVFKIITPLGSCNVLGTSFDVKIDRYGKTGIRVFKGIVAVRAHEDKKNRQLVLQRGMKTLLQSKEWVAEKPEKFVPSAIETKLNTEWEEHVFDKDDKRVGRSSLPPMLPELETKSETLNKLLSKNKSKVDRAKNFSPPVKIIARQRSAFLEMLRKQTLKKGSVISGRFEGKEDMIHKGHGSELGQYNKPEKFIHDDYELRNEYSHIRNRLLRVQSMLRQAQMGRENLVKRNSTSATAIREIQSLQNDIIRYRKEANQLLILLRQMQLRKK